MVPERSGLVMWLKRLDGFVAHRCDVLVTLSENFADFYAEATRQGTLWYRADGRLATPVAPVQWVCTGPISYIGQAALQHTPIGATKPHR